MSRGGSLPKSGRTTKLVPRLLEDRAVARSSEPVLLPLPATGHLHKGDSGGKQDIAAQFVLKWLKNTSACLIMGSNMYMTG